MNWFHIWMFKELCCDNIPKLLHKFDLGKTIHAYYMFINFCVFQNLYRCVTVAGTRMICPRRSRGGGRRDILHTRSLSRPSSGNWRWAFYSLSPQTIFFLPQTKHFHLRQKVFTSDVSTRCFFPLPPPFSILKWKKANQSSSGSHRWTIFWNTSSCWLKVSFHFDTESEEGQ